MQKNEFIEIVIGLITRLKCRPLSTVILENLAFVRVRFWYSMVNINITKSGIKIGFYRSFSQNFIVHLFITDNRRYNLPGNCETNAAVL